MTLRTIACTLAAGLAAASLATGAVAQDQTSIAWGGSNPGGVMYYMVGVAGTELGKDLPDVNITQVTTGGSTENAKRLIKGELDMGIVYGSHVFMAQEPTGPFKDGEKGDMFFHHSSVEGTTFEELSEGQQVEYTVGQGPKGPRAENVRLV